MTKTIETSTLYLSKPLKNQGADRRRKHDWRSAQVFEPGLYVLEVKEPDNAQMFRLAMRDRTHEETEAAVLRMAVKTILKVGGGTEALRRGRPMDSGHNTFAALESALEAVPAHKLVAAILVENDLEEGDALAILTKLVEHQHLSLDLTRKTAEAVLGDLTRELPNEGEVLVVVSQKEGDND
jgi:hypothetical protein